MTERIAAFLTVPQQAYARRASKALWEAVRAASMEDMLRTAVLEHQDATAIDTQLVVVAMSRVVGPFPSVDALVAWCGGLGSLCEELQLRFPHAAVIGVSARLAAIRPFPFASVSTTMTVCVLTAVASVSSALVLESAVLYMRNATNVPVRSLSHDGSLCAILCLEGATPKQFLNVHDVLLSSLPSIRKVEEGALRDCESLQSVVFANLPLLESFGALSFTACSRLFSVDLVALPCLLTIESSAFSQCESLQSISLASLPLLQSIGYQAFAECVRLSSFDFSALPSLRWIGEYAFGRCESLQSVSLANLPLLENIGDAAFAGCTRLSSVDLSGLPCLRWITGYPFMGCVSLQSISFANLPLLESIGTFSELVHLFCVKLSELPSLRLINDYAFMKCTSLQSVSLVNLPLLGRIGRSAFAECARLSSVALSGLPSLRTIGEDAFAKCESLPSISVASLPALQDVGSHAFDGCVRLSSVDLSQLQLHYTSSATHQTATNDSCPEPCDLAF